ncbi:hypothetical protein [Nocardioides solisilvae]|uniref:hypothetical protein n=1 Tax=Nocardioides solisilvae TaxID=1542435 RepID=UPI0013A58866|nr:hypothetical protein [Nocardioides solisilvae]
MSRPVTLSALRQVEPPVCALVAVSPVLTATDDRGSLDGTFPAPSLPPATWVAWETGNAGVADAARWLLDLAEAQGGDTRDLAVDTDDHSRQLVARHPDAAALVTDAVASCR